MFRRLSGIFGLLVLSLLAGLALLIAWSDGPDDLRRQLMLYVAVASAVGLAVVLLASFLLSRRFRRPVHDMVAAVEQIGAGAGRPRLPGHDEADLAALADTFNRASEGLTRRINELEEDGHQLRTILSGMVEGVVALGSDQRVLFVNGRARELLELQGEPVGRPFWEVVRNRPLLDAVRRVHEGPGPHREEMAWTGVVTRSLTVHAARLPGAEFRGAVLVLHDTTELRRLERLRQDFVANVSHELKTPLAVIQACVETLLDGAIDDEKHRMSFLGQIARQGERLHALVLDLLSLARLETGQELFQFGAVELGVAVRDCARRHRPRAEARRQSLRVEEGPAVQAWADEEAVEQVLENLLDNALKYTPEGGEVSARWGAEGGQAFIEVADTGIGIPAADLPRIFERFYRVDKARSRELGGTGLGLSIVKHLVQAMQGQVRAASEVGRGTTFTVVLPLAS
jgi:two-component system, OmpR family, phosphate regulon sensor histidine kinase PhoR